MKPFILIAATLILMTLFTACGEKPAPDVTPADPTETAATAAPTTALPSVGWITADSLRVRGGAGLSYEVIGGLKEGDQVNITGKSGDWYTIRFGDTTGYISAQYVAFTEPTSEQSTASASAGTTAAEPDATAAEPTSAVTAP